MKKGMFFADILRRCTLSIVLVFSTLCANAVPAKPGLIRRISLADGTSISARLVGDEFGHYWLGDDGQAYIDQQGKDIFALADIKAINNKAKAQRAQANQLRARRAAPRKANQANQANQVKGYFGKKKGVIILTEFSALSFKEGNDSVLFDRIANEIGYSEGKFIGSMRDYFYDQSKGKFELDFDVVGPVKLSKNYSYYGKNNSSGDDMHPAEMVSEACQLADSLVNFKDYDWDGDGEVDQVLVLFAGKGEADGGASNTVWPHEWQLSSAGYYGDGTGALKLDGVKIDTYACVSELDGSTGKVAGIGTMCHEFSHCLGFPDFYDTDYSGGQGMGYWDLMDNGSYNGNGYVPAGYTSYERWEAGWKEPIELKTDTIVTGMMPLQDDGETYIIYNDGHKNEYFLLENREPTGWDIHLPGKGLLILQVDYNAMAWQSNTPNDTPNHQRMTWIPADNKFQYTTYLGTKYYSEAGMANDPFPYGQVDAFSKWTQPEAKFYNKTANGTNYMDFSVKGIKRNADMTIDFTFKATRSIANPTFSIEGGVYHEAQTVAIECSTEGAEIYYTTNGTTPTTASTRYTKPIEIAHTTTLTAIAVANDEISDPVTATYSIRTDTARSTTYRLAKKIAELTEGQHCIIACGEHSVAAGPLATTYLSPETVKVEGDIITIDDNVCVFTLSGTGDTFSLIDEDGKYLYSLTTKTLRLGSLEKTWSLIEDKSGVILKYGNLGIIHYNISSPRFTTYTSQPGNITVYANLYVEYNDPDDIVEMKVRQPERKGTYTLSGVRVDGEKLTKGIYIVDGKKIAVK